MKPRECASDKTLNIFKYKVIAALFCGAAMIFSGCVNDIEKIKAFASPEELPVIHSMNFETTFTDSGMVKFYLKTPELKRYESDGQPFVEFPQGIHLVKYNDRGQVISNITSRYAKQLVKERRWEAKNNVIAVNANGDTLKTEHLVWDERAERIFSDQYVVIIRQDQIITGVGFESNQSLENWRIRNPRGTIYVQVKQEGAQQSEIDEVNPPLSRPVDIGNR